MVAPFIREEIKVALRWGAITSGACPLTDRRSAYPVPPWLFRIEVQVWGAGQVNALLDPAFPLQWTAHGRR